MYEELVKQLRYCATHECVGDGEKLVGCTAPYSEEYEGITTCNDVLQMRAADAIEELVATVGTVYNELANNEANKPRWIPVTERLPEKDKWVLRYSAITEATWLAYLNSAGVWMDEQGEAHYVTHWMPLPEPPKEET